jgi:hypothetical protein
MTSRSLLAVCLLSLGCNTPTLVAGNQGASLSTDEGVWTTVGELAPATVKPIAERWDVQVRNDGRAPLEVKVTGEAPCVVPTGTGTLEAGTVRPFEVSCAFSADFPKGAITVSHGDVSTRVEVTPATDTGCLMSIVGNPTVVDFGELTGDGERSLKLEVDLKGAPGCGFTAGVVGAGLSLSKSTGRIETLSPQRFKLFVALQVSGPGPFSGTFTLTSTLGQVIALPVRGARPPGCPSLDDATCPRLEAGFYVSSLDAVYRYQDGSLSLVTKPKTVTGRPLFISDIATFADGTLFVSEGEGVYLVDPSTGVAISVSPRTTGIVGLDDAGGGKLYLGKGTGGIVLLDPGTQQLSNVELSSAPQVSGDVATADGSLFLSTTGSDFDDLVKVDIATGVVTRIGNTGWKRLYGLMPTNGGLLGYTERGQVVFISLPSGDAHFITQLDIFVSGAATVH